MLEVSHKTKCIDHTRKSSDKIMLFDLVTDGHHPGYIQHLIHYWVEHDLPGTLDVVVSPKFIQKHTDIVDWVSKYGQGRVNLVPITIAEETALFPCSNYLQRKIHYFQQWGLCRYYAESLKATHCLLMYFDTFQIPIAICGKFPCSFSTIYFRPTFHYDDFKHHKLTWKDKLQQLQEKLWLSLVLRRQQLRTLFCLDSFVLKHFDQFNSGIQTLYLPDPVHLYSDKKISKEILREKIGIAPNRKVFLLFGCLDRRKGILQVLEAVSLLCKSLCQQICLLLVGKLHPDIESQVEYQLASISQSSPVQIITYNDFISEREIQVYFQLADAILAPYQRHVGMSGILIRAAAAQKPVLSSNYGLMGELVRNYQLGITVDSTIPAEITRGLTQFLLESPDKFCDRSKMKLLAEQNTVEKFAETIFQNL